MRVFVVAYVCLMFTSCSSLNWLIPDRMRVSSNVGRTERIGSTWTPQGDMLDNFMGEHWSIGLGFEYDLKPKRIEELADISLSLMSISATLREHRAVTKLTEAVEGAGSAVSAAVGEKVLTVEPEITIERVVIETPVVAGGGKVSAPEDDPHADHSFGHDILAFFEKLVSGDLLTIFKFLLVCIGSVLIAILVVRYRRVLAFFKREEPGDEPVKPEDDKS
jgi:hypothetical protein